MTLKVMVVDDTIFYRKIIKDVLETFPGVEVVGTVNSGQLALARIPNLKPDMITLDVEMPGMDGIQLLEEIQKAGWEQQVVMISSKTMAGSTATIRALELGAFDFITKPDDDSAQANIDHIKKHLKKLVDAVIRQKEIKKRLGISKPLSGPSPDFEPKIQNQTVSNHPNKPFDRTEKSAVVAIGVSTGGPNALAQMLPSIPADIDIPILLVQHMPPVFSASMAESLNRKCQLTVKEAENGEKVEPNTVYVAPGGTQMKVASGSSLTKIIRITDDAPENNCKPSVDYLFRSVAREYGSKSTCVVMTGMGVDGKLGVRVSKAAGAFSIAQDEASSVVYGMPKAIVDAGLADVVTPLDNIASEILKTLN